MQGISEESGDSRWLSQAHGEALFVSISGIIGAGKTTLAHALGAKLDLPVYYEGVINNPYLQDFYADMPRYAYPMQIYLLSERFIAHQKLIWQGKGGVQDRTIYEDSIFARMLCEEGHIDDRDYCTYKRLFSSMSNLMRKPNLIVHLDVTPETALARIRSRARECETGITLDYLRSLHAGYEAFLRDISRAIPVIRINYEEFKGDGEMAEAIVQQWASMQNIHDVSVPSPSGG